MTKSSKTLLLVLGGVAVLGAGGAAIYLATKKPPVVQGNGSTPKMPPPDGTPTANPVVSSTVEQLAQIANTAATMNLSMALKLAKQPIDMGSAGGASP